MAAAGGGAPPAGGGSAREYGQRLAEAEAARLSLVLLQGSEAELLAALPHLVSHAHRLGAQQGCALANLIAALAGRLAAAVHDAADARAQIAEQQQPAPDEHAAQDDVDSLEAEVRLLRAELRETRAAELTAPSASSGTPDWLAAEFAGRWLEVERKETAAREKLRAERARVEQLERQVSELQQSIGESRRVQGERQDAVLAAQRRAEESEARRRLLERELEAEGHTLAEQRERRAVAEQAIEQLEAELGERRPPRRRERGRSDLWISLATGQETRDPPGSERHTPLSPRSPQSPRGAAEGAGRQRRHSLQPPPAGGAPGRLTPRHGDAPVPLSEYSASDSALPRELRSGGALLGPVPSRGEPREADARTLGDCFGRSLWELPVAELAEATREDDALAASACAEAAARLRDLTAAAAARRRAVLTAVSAHWPPPATLPGSAPAVGAAEAQGAPQRRRVEIIGRLEREWRTKPGDVLDELVANFGGSAGAAGALVALAAVGRKLQRRGAGSGLCAAELLVLWLLTAPEAAVAAVLPQAPHARVDAAVAEALRGIVAPGGDGAPWVLCRKWVKTIGALVTATQWGAVGGEVCCAVCAAGGSPGGGASELLWPDPRVAHTEPAAAQAADPHATVAVVRAAHGAALSCIGAPPGRVMLPPLLLLRSDAAHGGQQLKCAAQQSMVPVPLAREMARAAAEASARLICVARHTTDAQRRTRGLRGALCSAVGNPSLVPDLREPEIDSAASSSGSDDPDPDGTLDGGAYHGTLCVRADGAVGSQWFTVLAYADARGLRLFPDLQALDSGDAPVYGVPFSHSWRLLTESPAGPAELTFGLESEDGAGPALALRAATPAARAGWLCYLQHFVVSEKQARDSARPRSGTVILGADQGQSLSLTVTSLTM
eukprot:TRINITY_DN47313_c0_g1_i1.p1 TRINITY_DN47313_c0_g1~~TRINITY_DN47313_c0_g1_i1.p1  ORF type:complete len:925 (+),score=268.38 TRINITY_DN47313_c0_g1_i1:84-2777(+)